MSKDEKNRIKLYNTFLLFCSKLTDQEILETVRVILPADLYEESQETSKPGYVGYYRGALVDVQQALWYNAKPAEIALSMRPKDPIYNQVESALNGVLIREIETIEEVKQMCNQLFISQMQGYKDRQDRFNSTTPQ